MSSLNLSANTEAKANLKRVLTAHHGDTKHPEVVKAIAFLASLNPTPNPARHRELLEGNWLLISAPNFPGRIEDGSKRFIYTLGRLAFNKFEPIDLQVVLERISQPIFAIGENRSSHDIVVEFKIIEPGFPQLKAIVKNLAVCSPLNEDTLQVEFTGGELLIGNGTEQIKQWLNLFNSDRSLSQISFLDRFKFWWVQQMFGIGEVSKIDPQTGKQEFAIAKSPKGKLKLLYLDEELRITQGRKESVLICQREP